MHLLRRTEAETRPTRARVGFSVGSAIIGFFVVSGYGAGIAWLWTHTKLPAPVLVLNGALWLFFAWYWQHNLRRVLGAGPRFALAVSDRALLLPLNHVDKSPPEDLDLVLEIPRAQVKRCRYVDLRTILRTDHGGRRQVSNRQTFVLRVELAAPAPEALREALTRIRALDGFKGAHLHLPRPDHIEARFSLGQSEAVKRTLRTLDPALEPAAERETHDLTRAGVDEAGFEAGLDRLEAHGETLAASRARRVRANQAGDR